MGVRWYLTVGRAVLAHPALWPTAATQLWRLRRRRWWRRPPFLPLPGVAYLRFRMVTAYGDPDRRPDPADVVAYLGWCRDWPAATRVPSPGSDGVSARERLRAHH